MSAERKKIEKTKQDKDVIDRNFDTSESAFSVKLDKIAVRILAKPMLFISLFFVFDVILFGFLNMYPKTIAVYNDEMFYYCIARCLFKGGDIMVRHFSLDFHKILYSILLAPTFAIADSIMRIRAVAFLNAFIISLSVFPVFGIARKLLKKDSQILAVMFIWLIFPAKVVGAGYMCEITNLPLTELFVYLVVKGYYIRKDINRLLMAVILGVVQFLLYFNKEISIYFGIAYCIAMICRIVADKEKKLINLVSLAIFGGVAFGLNTLIEKIFFFENKNAYASSYAYISNTISGRSSFLALFQVGYFLIYNLIFMVISFGVFTVVIPLLTVKRQDMRDRFITIFLFTAIFVAMGAVAFLINQGETSNGYSTRVHLRYVEPLILPVLVLFISVMSKYRAYIRNNKNLIVIGHTVYLSLFIAFGYTFEFGSMVDDTTFRVYQKISEALDEISIAVTGGNLFSLLLRLAMAGGFAIVLALLYKREKYFMTVSFSVFAIALFSNFLCSYYTFRGSYRMDRETVSLYDETKDYLDDLNGNVLIASTDLYIQRGYDSFMDLDKLYCTSMRSVYLAFDCPPATEEELVIDLDTEKIHTNYPEYDYAYEDLDSISYVILKDGETIAFNADRIAGFPLESLGFSLYKLEDPSKLCLKFNTWDQMTDREKADYEYINGLVQSIQ